MRNKYDYILNLCVSETKENIKLPFVIGDYIYSTNGFIAVRVYKDKVGGDYKENDFKTVETVETFFKYKKQKTISFKTEKLLALFSEINMNLSTAKEECDKCYGSGYTECYCCSSEIECSLCDGSGETGTMFKMLKVEFGVSKMKIGEYSINPNFLHIALLTAVLNNQDEITFDFNESNSAVVSKIGDVEIIIMLML